MRSPTHAECNYTHIERELLSIMFARERFHRFIFGTKVEAEADQKLLVSLFKEPLCDCSLRVQKLLLREQRYDMFVEYTTGKRFITAECTDKIKTNCKSVVSSYITEIET